MTPPLAIYYRDDMAPADSPTNYSKSPTKPRRFLEYLHNTPLWQHLEVRADFAPLTRDQLLLAHKPEYVDAFLAGEPRWQAESNGLAWTPPFRDSVLLTNACLLAAIAAAVANPQVIAMAPVSGFHHARPSSGSGFCTFSGQVIAGLELYRQRGLRGAWIDLDGHFGNSIEDSREFAADLDVALARGLNINPGGRHADYLADLQQNLLFLTERAAAGEVDYICVAHGADSHEWDQLGNQCTTAEWLEAANLTYAALAEIRALQPRVGVALALFGGYRDDHPPSVLGLHAMDTARALVLLGGVQELEGFMAEVRPA